MFVKFTFFTFGKKKKTTQSVKIYINKWVNTSKIEVYVLDDADAAIGTMNRNEKTEIVRFKGIIMQDWVRLRRPTAQNASASTGQG